MDRKRLEGDVILQVSVMPHKATDECFCRALHVCRIFATFFAPAASET